MEIRKATADDFDSVYDLINLLENEVLDREVQRRIYSQNLDNSDVVYLLALDSQKPVGFLSLHVQHLLHHASKIGEIQEMVVSEQARNSGVGKQLIREIKRIANDMAIPQLEVTSSFKREGAHRFYEREGFAHTHKKFTWKNEAE